MPSGLQVFDASGALILDADDLVFRILGNTRIVGSTAGNANLDGGSGTIVNAGFTAGSPFCMAMWEGTVNNGGASSADPPAPNISFSGNTLSYSLLWGDWRLVYGVA
jgi:hypothetical protein